MSFLTIQNLEKTFGGLTAIQHCSLSVEANSITGLIGPNGAGKTTLFDLISGFQRADSGHILYKNENITDLPIHKRAKRGIGRTFQNIRIFGELSVLDNIVVAFPEYPQKLYQAFSPFKKRVKQLQKKALELLEEVGIAEKAHLRASELSYGQKKLLEIARAVASGAEIFLLDEPAAGINATTLHKISAYILALHKKGKTFLIVEHNMPFIMEICQKIIVLDEGKEIAIGTPKEIQNNPKVLEAYLGKKKS